MRLLGLAIGLATTLVIRASALTFPQNGDRRFDVMRKGKDIGDHRYRFSGAPDAFTLNVSTDVEVKAPLIRMTAHSFKHASTETWKGGKLQQLSSNTLDDGPVVSSDEIEDLCAIAESCTVEINWQDGDVAVLDNTRVMHGRCAIKDADRQPHIGMGRAQWPQHPGPSGQPHKIRCPAMPYHIRAPGIECCDNNILNRQIDIRPGASLKARSENLPQAREEANLQAF